MQFDIITIFPPLFDSFIHESLISKALRKNIISIRIINIRDFAADKHKAVDDRPYGGGPGMLLKVDSLVAALESVVGKRPSKRTRVILLTPSGAPFTQKKAVTLSKKYDRLVFLCGRYEGFDARIRKFVDEEISIGPYILNGGEIAAMAIIEAVARLIPGVIGNEQSLIEESHSMEGTNEYPQYTRPEDFRGLRVPKVLLSGDHRQIAEWRKKRIKIRKKAH